MYKLETICQSVEKGEDTPEIRQHMANLSHSEELGLTSGERGVLNYFSNPKVPWTEETKNIFRTMRKKYNSTHSSTTSTFQLPGDITGLSESLRCEFGICPKADVEPIIQFNEEGTPGYQWKLQIPSVGLLGIDHNVYLSFEVAKYEADQFLKNLSKFQGWLDLGIHVWLAKNASRFRSMDISKCRAEVLRVRGEFLLLFYEVFEHNSQSHPTIDRFTSKLRTLRDPNIITVWTVKGYVPLNEQKILFYVGYPFIGTESELQIVIPKISNILCEFVTVQNKN